MSICFGPESLTSPEWSCLVPAFLWADAIERVFISLLQLEKEGNSLKKKKKTVVGLSRQVCAALIFGCASVSPLWPPPGAALGGHCQVQETPPGSPMGSCPPGLSVGPYPWPRGAAPSRCSLTLGAAHRAHPERSEQILAVSQQPRGKQTPRHNPNLPFLGRGFRQESTSASSLRSAAEP